MANLKQDLDEYLLLQSDQKKNFKIDMKMPSLKVSEIGKLFGRSNTEEANSWLKDTQDSCCPKISRLQRIMGFLVCIMLGALCCILSTFYIPVLILKARKFCLLYTLGSLFFILGFCFLWGLTSFLKHLIFNKTRLFVSLTYLGSLFAALYFSLVMQSTPSTVIAVFIQASSLIVLIFGAIPGGTTGMKFFTQLFCRSRSSQTLPI